MPATHVGNKNNTIPADSEADKYGFRAPNSYYVWDANQGKYVAAPPMSGGGTGGGVNPQAAQSLWSRGMGWFGRNFFNILGLGTSIFGYKQARDAAKKQEELADRQLSLYESARPYAEQFLSQGASAISPVLNYYGRRLSGDRYITQEAMAPELNDINQRYSGSAAVSRGLYPRGGMAPNAAQEMRNRQNAELTNAMLKARPMAAQALASFAPQVAGLGFQGLGMGAGIYGNVAGNLLASNDQQLRAGQGIGNSLYQMYQSYLLGKSLNNQNPGGGGMTMNTQPSYNPDNDPWSDPNWGTGVGSSIGLYGSYSAPQSGTSVPNSGRVTSNLYTPRYG